MKLHTIGLVGAFLSFSGAASADFTNSCGMPPPPYSDQEIGGTVGPLSSPACVQAMFCNGTAGFTSELYLDASPDVFIAEGNVTSSGTVVNLGAFAAGTELVFFIVTDEGYTFFTGPASRNPDNLEHAIVVDLGGGELYVAFEDLFGGGDNDFDDIQFIVRIDAADADNDGVPDCADQCSGTASGAVVDESGCSIAQLCPCDNNWRNHGAYVSCVAHAAEDFVDAGLITEAEKGGIVSAAGRSSCGK